MKKILVAAMSIAILCSLFGFKKDTYVIYCLPLRTRFFVPPDKEHIMKYGTRVETSEPSSFVELVLNSQSSKAEPEDFNNLRVLIIRTNDNLELYITSDKKVLVSDKKYNVDNKKIDDLLSHVGCH